MDKKLSILILSTLQLATIFQATSAIRSLTGIAQTFIKANRFYFVRHGETDWNKERKTMGQIDIPLNETGHAQATSVARILKEAGIKKIATSPLTRAQQTARIIANILGQEVIIVDEFRGRFWGTREGQIKKSILLPPDWRNDGTLELAEPYPDFLARIRGGIETTLADEEPVLIVSHGGVFLALKDILGVDMASASLILNADPVVITRIQESWDIQALTEQRRN